MKRLILLLFIPIITYSQEFDEVIVYDSIKVEGQTRIGQTGVAIDSIEVTSGQDSLIFYTKNGTYYLSSLFNILQADQNITIDSDDSISVDVSSTNNGEIFYNKGDSIHASSDMTFINDVLSLLVDTLKIGNSSGMIIKGDTIVNDLFFKGDLNLIGGGDITGTINTNIEASSVRVYDWTGGEAEMSLAGTGFTLSNGAFIVGNTLSAGDRFKVMNSGQTANLFRVINDSSDFVHDLTTSNEVRHNDSVLFRSQIRASYTTLVFDGTDTLDFAETIEIEGDTIEANTTFTVENVPRGVDMFFSYLVDATGGYTITINGATKANGQDDPSNDASDLVAILFRNIRGTVYYWTDIVKD